ncbi:MAG: c-type cytochrome domain-containing protein [Prosthecobacter sp.]|nr:c-type cytochrome domain-containing protein [Prosthecobacter sp.]
MNMKHITTLVACLSLTTALHAAEEPLVDFVKQVKPILADRCVECHNSETIFGELNLQSRELAFRKRKLAPAIVPGEPEKSMLYLALTLPPKDKKAMPATGHRIPKDEVSIIRQWIKEGAKWPEGKEGVVSVKRKKS